MPQKDNTTYAKKVALRRKALSLVSDPVVMETHGGEGKLFRACYTQVDQGVVFEKNPEKSAILGRQRPTWAVYEGDCVACLKAGVGAHLTVNLLDLDPYGQPWPVLDAFFGSERPRPETLVVVVNDGLRQKVRYGGAWGTKSMREMVRKHGNDIYGVYLDVCAELMQEKAAQAGYRLDRFAGYYCGHIQNVTHYLAILKRDG